LITLAFTAATALAHNGNHLNFEQIVMQAGYIAESYTVVTQDGYVEQIYRIPGKLSEAGINNHNKPAVLMMHGLMCDFKFWLANDADLAPPFILADNGYDVWLGNNRGSKYGQAHVSMDKSEKAFWETNYVDMGLYDVPAQIDFITNLTGQDKITYIGHS